MIILLGFPKSGTTSFNKLFESLGLNSYHWKKNGQFIGLLIKKNKQQGLPLLSDFKTNDCITQLDVCKSSHENYWPQIVDFQQLYTENKDSVFILNKRDPQKILESFKKWNNFLDRLFKFNPELVTSKTDQGFLDLVEKHYQRVEQFFKSHKKAKFLVFDIEKDNLQKLNKYLDIKGRQHLPWENKNTPKNKLLYSKRKTTHKRTKKNRKHNQTKKNIPKYKNKISK